MLCRGYSSLGWSQTRDQDPSLANKLFPLIDRGMTGGDPAPQGYERESQVGLSTLVLKGLCVGVCDVAALPQSF